MKADIKPDVTASLIEALVNRKFLVRLPSPSGDAPQCRRFAVRRGNVLLKRSETSLSQDSVANVSSIVALVRQLLPSACERFRVGGWI